MLSSGSYHSSCAALPPWGSASSRLCELVAYELADAEAQQLLAQLVASGAIDLKPMVTHHFGMDDITKAFETLRDDPTAIKIMIHPNK